MCTDAFDIQSIPVHLKRPTCNVENDFSINE